MNPPITPLPGFASPGQPAPQTVKFTLNGSTPDEQYQQAHALLRHILGLPPVASPGLSPLAAPMANGASGLPPDMNAQHRQRLIDSLLGDVNSPHVAPLMQSNPDLARALGWNPPPAPGSSGPLADTQTLNTFANPFGGGNPYGVTSAPPLPSAPNAPTPLDLYAHAAQQNAQHPTPYDQLGLQAQAGQQGAQASLNAVNQYLPAPNAADYAYHPFNGGPYPQHEFPAIPNRQAPGSDTASSILGALAGFLDPVGAGQYNANPLSAASHYAEQQYQDNLNRYKMAFLQADMQHQTDVAGHEEGLHYNFLNQQQFLQHLEALRNAQSQYAGILAPHVGQVAQDTTLAAGFPILASQQHGADAGAANAGLIHDYLTELDRQSTGDERDFNKKAQILAALMGSDDRAKDRGLRREELQRYHDLQFSPDSPQNQARLIGAYASWLRANGYADTQATRQEFLHWQMNGRNYPDGSTGAIHYPQGFTPGQGNPQTPPDPMKDPAIRQAQKNVDAAQRNRDEIGNQYNAQLVKNPKGATLLKPKFDQADTELRNAQAFYNGLISNWRTNAPGGSGPAQGLGGVGMGDGIKTPLSFGNTTHSTGGNPAPSAPVVFTAPGVTVRKGGK